MALAVLTPGLLTTVQDLGRHGARRFGVPRAGALDAGSLRAGNALVGNGAEAAGLEATLRGPVLRFLDATTFAITGGEFEARLGPALCRLWTRQEARAGDELDMGTCRLGVRGYLAVAGGIDVPLVLGSRSTCLRGAFGGLRGGPLRAGDRLPVGRPSGAPAVASPWRPALGRPVRLRLQPGPHADLLPQGDWGLLLGADCTLRHDSDRMGARLDGPPLAAPRPEVLTLPCLPGGVQLTPGGQIIVLLNDAPTTGGYPLIGAVPTDDLARLAQARPGASVRFVD